MKEKRRPYKNQRQRDLELCNAYHLGILDERKKWLKVQKENIILKSRERIKLKGCFCMGDRNWTPFCAECQSFFNMNKEELMILKKQIKGEK